MKHIFVFLLLTITVLVGLNTVPFAGISVQQALADEHDDAREALRRGDILPYSQIKRIVESQLDGKVVGQKLRRTNRGWQYDLRLRPPNGRVMVLVVNAKNGNIISKR
ncbi:PepSY domain-containing protein [Kordiimonas aquimaris]|uniref:PepSY domain-containing protein n=1 Tax=Kordiimonas aquimaris TaxID=707591 RepID=UPI0021D215DA|nr:hypothetical protein [Kordiimonas aquimaris]